MPSDVFDHAWILLNYLFKKRLLGAAILLLLLAVLLPAFLTGSGDVLTLPDSSTMPEPPIDLRAKLDKQISMSRKLQEQLDSRPVTTDGDGETIISKAIPLPEPEPDAVSKDGDSPLYVPEESAQDEPKKQQPQPDVKVQEKKQQIDLIGQLEKRKRAKWVLQVGAFQNPDNAEEMVRKLKGNIDSSEVFVQKRNIDDNSLYIVFIGPVFSRAAVNKHQTSIDRKFKIKSVVRTYEELGISK